MCASVKVSKTLARKETNWREEVYISAPSTNPEVYRMDLSESVPVGTRKIANYACIG